MIDVLNENFAVSEFVKFDRITSGRRVSVISMRKKELCGAFDAGIFFDDFIDLSFPAATKALLDVIPIIQGEAWRQIEAAMNMLSSQPGACPLKIRRGSLSESGVLSRENLGSDLTRDVAHQFISSTTFNRHVRCWQESALVAGSRRYFCNCRRLSRSIIIVYVAAVRDISQGNRTIATFSAASCFAASQRWLYRRRFRSGCRRGRAPAHAMICQA